MPIKIKNRDPKTTDFKKDEAVINITDGSLFYKSNKGLHKVATTTVVTTAVTTATEDLTTSISDLVDTSPSLTTEDIQVIVGNMFENNTETNINATYDSVAGVINLEVPVQTEDDDGEIITGNFYSIGLSDNNGTINATDSDLMLASNHESSNGLIESDKSSIVLKKDEAKIEINGDLVTNNNTLDEGDNPIGTGRIETAPGGNITAGGNIRGDKLILTDYLGNEWYITVNPWMSNMLVTQCPDGTCT